MTASAYKRPFAEPKGCISERQQPAKSCRSKSDSVTIPTRARRFLADSTNDLTVAGLYRAAKLQIPRD